MASNDTIITARVEEAISDITREAQRTVISPATDKSKRDKNGGARAIIKGNNHGTDDDPHPNTLLHQQNDSVKPEWQNIIPASNTTTTTGSQILSSDVILSNKQEMIMPVIITSVSNVQQSSAQRTEKIEFPSSPKKTEKKQSPAAANASFELFPILVGNTSVSSSVVTLRDDSDQDLKQEKDDDVRQRRKTDSNQPRAEIRGNVTSTTALRLSRNARFVPASSSTNPQRPDIRYKPPSKVIRKRIDDGDLTAGQFVLDFAILGFPKCGTSTMSTYTYLPV
jgi:hypothetical protein